IAIGLVAGHLIFGLSLLATHLSWRDAWSHFFDFGPIWNFTMDSPVVLTRFLGVAVAEELIWRVAAQTILVSFLAAWMPAPAAAGVGIAVIAAAFVVVHKHFFENTWHISLEFIVFALLLGILYHATGSFILVMVIHALRDIEIAYLEYLIKIEELGDEEQAAKAIEQAYMPGRPGNL
ncbi:MAG: CPBP family intramembrane metalloprotease, partial [Candidatus Hydrogenedentes bacterium]|nr:CPBP family intramembrane metalloprotease [Candidatus Hydrogenedentota bacterium]